MGGTDHTRSPAETPGHESREERDEREAAQQDATLGDERAVAGGELGFSLAGPSATDTPPGSSARPGPNDGTIEVDTSGGASEPAADATQVSGSGTLGSSGTVGGTSRQAAAGPVLAGFADYELIAEVARGGMGVVYRARQISLNRVVAVKMILAGQLASQSDVLRFRSEAEAAANLQHPNIVSIYEVGEYGGQHYFSMQFIDGRSLTELVRDGQLPARKAVEIVRTVADAVQYAHDQGILHRDLKPSNILIDRHGEPHLTDFGVAKRLSGESQITATGAILGTPGYMPPEQAAGKREVGPAADVYALGGILYESLTGRPPFKGERVVDVLMQVMNSEPVSPRVLNPSVPEDLATVCLKCLQKEPHRRYATASALSADLGRWLEGEPIEARPIGRLERTWRWCRRNPLVAGLLATLVLIGVAAFVSVTSQWLVAQSALRRMQQAQAERAMAQVDALMKAAPDSLSSLLDSLEPYQEQIAPRLRELLARQDLSDVERLRASLALLPLDPSQAAYLRERLLSVGPDELLAVREALYPYRDQLREGLWAVLNDARRPPAERFAAGLVLAGYDPDIDGDPSRQWQASAAFLTEKLLEAIGSNPSSYEPLLAALRPARGILLEPLTAAFRDEQQPDSVRDFATNILVDYAADRPPVLAELLLDADPRQFQAIKPVLARSSSDATTILQSELARESGPDVTERDKDHFARRQANAAIALLQLGVTEPLWPLLKHSEDPRLRSWLVERLAALGTDPALLAARLKNENDTTARRAIILALGSYDPADVPAELRNAILEHCTALYPSDPDGGMHSAIEWLARRWGESNRLDAAAIAADSQTTPRWITAVEGHTLVVIDGRSTFKMGSPSREPQRSVAERPRPMTIGRSFAMATKEVTVEQYLNFCRATKAPIPLYTRMHSPVGDGPMIMVTWYRAAQYCRWLSQQAGIPEEQMCYPPLDEIKEGMTPYPDYLERTGFRLPTEAEWEFAARAGTTSSRSFGNSEELLSHYAYYLLNGEDRAWPCGSLKPNDLGLFDMYGNVWEWCQDRWTSYWETSAKEDRPDPTPIRDSENRVIRGGSFESPAKFVRSAFHDRSEKPIAASDEYGFRVVRTVRE